MAWRAIDGQLHRPRRKGRADITDQISKIGLLGKADGEPDPLNTEFAYLETKEKAAPHKVMKYGVVVTGIRSKPNPRNAMDRVLRRSQRSSAR